MRTNGHFYQTKVNCQTITACRRLLRLSSITLCFFATDILPTASVVAQPPTPPSDPLVAKELEKREAELDAAIAKAKRSEADARFPASSVKPPEGTTTIDKSEIEVHLRGFNAMADLASQISNDLWLFKTPNGGMITDIVIYDATTAKARLHVRTFMQQLNFLGEQYNRVLPPPTGTQGDPVTSGAAIGLIKALADIASFAQTNIDIKGQDVKIDESALVTAMVSALRRIENNDNSNRSITVHYPAVLASISSGIWTRPLIQTILALQVQRTRAEQLLTIDRATLQNASATPPAKQVAQQRIDQVQPLNTFYDQLVGGLFKFDTATGANALTSLLGAAALDEVLNKETAYILRPIHQKSGGNTRIKTNLFTKVFTGNRISYSGGSIVSYELYDNKNRLIDGKLLPKYLPYTSANNITKQQR